MDLSFLNYIPANWLSAGEAAIVSAALSGVAYQIADRLPLKIAGPVSAIIAQRFSPESKQTDKEKALQLVLNASDFVASVGVLYTLWVAFLLELWKFSPSGHAVELIILVCASAAPVLSLFFFQIETIGLDDATYKKIVGHRLKRLILAMVILIPVGSALERLAEEPHVESGEKHEAQLSGKK